MTAGGPPVTPAPTSCHTARRGGALPDLVVIHYTAMDGADAALDRLCDPAFEVSAHYLIREDGHIWQMVDESQRAWHAGAGAWGDVSDVNSRSIGIELDNRGDAPFAEAQMQALMALLPGIMARWSIPPERIIGHSDMAPGRKIDPGPYFDWPRLAGAGLAIWPKGTGVAGDFIHDAKRFGYVPAAGCEDTETLILDAFRLRFRPFHSGPMDDTDRAIMAELAARWPVDRAGISA